jgi:hypothetical protein
MAAEDNLNPAQFYYHGTTTEGLGNVQPAAKHGGSVAFPHDTDKNYAYATPNEDDAWHYAEKTWNATASGIPRVYKVQPSGPVEPDPQYGPHGSRGNFESDVRSRHQFKVIGEIPMPEHMGEPEEWR